MKNIFIVMLLALVGMSHAKSVVVIVVDDLRADALGYAGSPIATPSIDRLAAQGVRFENAFVVQSVCAPSRATMLTGQYPRNHGITSNGMAFDGNETTIARALQQTHRTAMIGKWHLSSDYSTPPLGWDKFYSLWFQSTYLDPIVYDNGVRGVVEGYTGDLITDEAISFLESLNGEDFFLWLSFKGVHSPWEPSERRRGTLDGFDWEVIRRPNASRISAEREQIYHETLLSVDDNVGRLLDALSVFDLDDSTLVVFISDNGLMRGEHNKWSKRYFFEESIRIPFIVRKPGTQGGQVRHQVALNVDLAPTVLDWAGVDFDDDHEVDGVSLLPVIDVPFAETRSGWLYVYYRDLQFPDIAPLFAWVTTEYKYVTFPYGGGPHVIFTGSDLLYNVSDDPFEMNNLLQKRRVNTGISRNMEELLWEALR